MILFCLLIVYAVAAGGRIGDGIMSAHSPLAPPLAPGLATAGVRRPPLAPADPSVDDARLALLRPLIDYSVIIIGDCIGSKLLHSLWAFA